jgi:hypothetical protein
VLVFSLVSPAVGGPSLRSVAKSAKKALSTAKKANRAAVRANNNALDAGDLGDQAFTLAEDADTKASKANTLAGQADTKAGQAITKADQALARGVVTDGGITIVSSQEVISPGSFATHGVACPGGQRGDLWRHDLDHGRRRRLGLRARQRPERLDRWRRGSRPDRRHPDRLRPLRPGGQVVAAGNRRARARRQVAALERKKMRAEGALRP